MNSILVALIAMLPNVLMKIAAKFLSEEIVQDIIERVITSGLKHASKLTTNTLDDEAAKYIIETLKRPK